jgi:hypothetical protein
MIQIFRKIRQNLIASGNTGKYIKYAIGEIVLVVIGILIALQINNWNEQQNERKIEKQYMQNMLEDLRDDLVIYENFQKRNNEIYSLVDSIVTGLKANDRKEHVGEKLTKAKKKSGSIVQ